MGCILKVTITNENFTYNGDPIDIFFLCVWGIYEFEPLKLFSVNFAVCFSYLCGSATPSECSANFPIDSF